ncbi:MAG TPA: response regulator [Candidatus Tectomicrobia bacterium]|nr:response regulator [Candidatus Tectomicrobia bacterium]
MTVPCLLLVEDDQDNLEVLALLLSERYRVASHASAADALAALDTSKPDLVLLDIGMHPVDGFACLAAIRATPGYETIPAIAVTGFVRDVERRAILAAGFQAMVAKPILDHRELEALIDRLLASSSGRRGASRYDDSRGATADHEPTDGWSVAAS